MAAKKPTGNQSRIRNAPPARKPPVRNTSGGDLANPGRYGNVPGQSYGRDLSSKNAAYVAEVAGRNKAARTNSKTKPR